MPVSDKLAIMSINASFHARKLAHQVFEDEGCFYVAYQHREARAEGRIPYIIGFYSQGESVGSRRVMMAHYSLIGLNPATNVVDQEVAIIHWIGTDIVNATELALHHEKRMFEKLAHPNIIHLVEMEEHAEEMRQLMPDVDFQIVSLPLVEPFEMTPFDNDEPLVSVYMPPMRMDYYRMDTILAAARHFPKVRFEFYYYYDVREEAELIDGTENCYWVPGKDYQGMKEQVKRSKVFVRLPVHDGLSVQVLEFASAGRSVIYNKRLPYVDYIEDKPEYEKSPQTRIKKLIDRLDMALARTEPNEKMAEYYATHHGKQKYLNQMAEIVRQAEEKRNIAKLEAPRVAALG